MATPRTLKPRAAALAGLAESLAALRGVVEERDRLRTTLEAVAEVLRHVVVRPSQRSRRR